VSLQLCLNAPHIPKDNGDVIFSAPWEARAFALVVKLHDAGHFSWKQWVETFSAEVARAENAEHIREGHTDDYYECWLAAMEKLLKLQGLMTDESLEEEIQRTLENWPHPDHVVKREPIARDPAKTGA
jgi:nitrile hydratase accessory protein